MLIRKPPALPIAAVILGVSVFFLSANAFAASSFYDVTEDTLFSPYIQKLYEAHLITGDTENGKEVFRFRPKDSLTRAEFTKVAVGVKLAEKYGITEDWQSKSAYEITETVLKDKLLYFHGCSNADLSNCSSLCGADICGVCNVCQIIGEKPFTDVAIKSRDCEEEGVCTPWYSEYIYYVLRKGMVKGYRAGSSYAFHPNDPILRIHALKLIMADDGAVDPEADERYRRLSQTAKSRGSYYPKCLSGAENLILNNNGSAGSGDGEKLLKYALLADKLDFFGNTCQVFNEAGARTAQQRADFLQKTLTRQEVARYFVLSSSYNPLMLAAEEDPTVEEVVSMLTDPNTPTEKETPGPQLSAPDSADPTLKVYAANVSIQTDPFESTYNRPACIRSLSTPRLCKDATISNCFTVSDGTKITTTDEELYGRTPTGYYTWLWHGVIYGSKNYYVPTDDLDFNCTVTVKAPVVKNTVELASAPVTEVVATKVKKVSYPSPDCNVIMSCEPIITYETVYETKMVTAATVILKNADCGVTMSCNPAPEKPVSNGNWISDNVTKPVGKALTEAGKWATEQAINVGKEIAESTQNVIRFSPYGTSSTEVWQLGAEYYLRARDYDISADMLEHSLPPDPSDLEFDDESEVAMKIRESDIYKNAIDFVKNAVLTGNLTSEDLDEEIKLEFTSGDLFTSIGKAALKYNATKTDDGYIIDITITDDYNFELKLGEYKSNSFVTTMNNKALFDQYLGVIHNYSTKIEIQEFIPFNQADDEHE